MEEDSSAQTLDTQNQKTKVAFGDRLKEALLPNATFVSGNACRQFSGQALEIDAKDEVNDAR